MRSKLPKGTDQKAAGISKITAEPRTTVQFSSWQEFTCPGEAIPRPQAGSAGSLGDKSHYINEKYYCYLPWCVSRESAWGCSGEHYHKWLQNKVSSSPFPSCVYSRWTLFVEAGSRGLATQSSACGAGEGWVLLQPCAVTAR